MLDLVDVMMSEVNCDSRSCDVNWFVDRRVAAKVWIVGILDNMTMAMMDAKDRNNFVYLVVFPLFAREIICLPFYHQGRLLDISLLLLLKVYGRRTFIVEAKRLLSCLNI